MIITCTAISDKSRGHIFGRTLDLEYSLDEAVILTPRCFGLKFLHLDDASEHYSIIGAAHLTDGMPLYYDAVNEFGLCAAALSFPHFSEYASKLSGKLNVASFELIPFVLSRAKNVEEARSLLEAVNITDESFSKTLPATPLHWMFADSSQSITLESTHCGIKIYDNPANLLTNSPSFENQLTNLERYAHIISSERRLPRMHSRGLEGFGIPGDFSSGSRFVRAVYLLSRTKRATEPKQAVSRFFHIMESVSQPSGATLSEDGSAVRTVYTSAIDAERLEYFFTTYENRRIRCVKLETRSASGKELAVFPMHTKEDILELNLKNPSL